MSGNHVHCPWNAKRAFCALACCLVVLLACAAVFAGSSAAKYVEQDVGADSARVAGIVVEAESNGSGSGTIDLDNAQAGSAEYRLTVSNGKGGTVSEVAYEYDIVVKATSGNADGVTVSLRDGRSSKTFVSGKDMVSFDNAGVLPAGMNDSNEHVLRFSANGAAIGEIQFDISVHAEQTD